MAVHRTLAAAALAGALFAPLSAGAQQPSGPARPGERAQAAKGDGYSYQFPDDPLAGGGLSANEPLIKVRVGAARATLVKPRVSFVPQMLKSVENL